MNGKGETDCFWCGTVYQEDGHETCPHCATPTGSISVVKISEEDGELSGS